MDERSFNHHYHQPVLLQEAVAALSVSPDEIYVDATFGGGGHSGEILRKLGPGGRLIAFEQDKDAWKNVIHDERVTLVTENFRHLKRFLKLHNAVPVAGILADLGVSSWQFDTPERGFSIRYDAPLDMRMDKRQSVTAASVLQQYDEAALQQLFEQYGEVHNARTLAQRIVQARSSFPMKTVAELKAVAGGISKGNPQRYLAKVFQALRIEVNDELNALREMLYQAAEVMRPGGRLVVITFHSLEDRIVKDFIKNVKIKDEDNKVQERFRIVYKKPITPSPEEIKLNPRARSARLRVAEKVKE
jgi:16S rRNA (cytosine1402-N4)-methyltransferase